MLLLQSRRPFLEKQPKIEKRTGNDSENGKILNVRPTHNVQPARKLTTLQKNSGKVLEHTFVPKGEDQMRNQ